MGKFFNHESLALWIVGSVYAVDEFEELARNGGFEKEIQAADWIIEMRAGEQANLPRDKKEVFAGKYSAFFEVITFENDMPQFTQERQKIEAGEEYTLLLACPVYPTSSVSLSARPFPNHFLHQGAW